jgi:hypothetical protein
MQPGDRVVGGVVVRVTDDGVYLGRVAEPGEVCPAHHDEYQFGDLRVFLAHAQGPIAPKSAPALFKPMRSAPSEPADA